jgi:putative tricarboxylic transport membrane protein
MRAIRNPRDFWAGLIFIAFGVTALWLGRNYQMGTLMRMGPGYLPRALSLGLVGIGCFVLARAFFNRGEAIGASAIRPQFFILLAIVAFGLTIERFGLAPAVFVTTLTAALASRQMKWLESLALAIGMAIGSIVLFIYVLGQSMEKWIFF